MSIHPQTGRSPQPMVHPFPTPGPRVKLAYRELHLAAYGTDEEKKQLKKLGPLPRPWDPASCQDPNLRQELWQWLEAVVVWFNREYTWDVAGMIPTCWPSHPHLVHEIAVVADQRRQAGLALTSDALEEWHRYCLPAFVDRMRQRLKSHCDDEHAHWPGRGRHNQHTSDRHRETRANTYTDDVAALPSRSRDPSAAPARRLEVVDLETGQIQGLDHD